MKIFLIPGHGGKDSGATGPTGLKEKDVALTISTILERQLIAAGHSVGVSRAVDLYLSPKQQREATDAWRPEIAIALHLNGAVDPDAKGFEVFTTRGQTRADSLATKIFHSLAAQFRNEPGRLDLIDGDPDKEADYQAIMCQAPAVLVEFGFLTNPETEERFRRLDQIEAAALAVAIGIEQWIHSKGATKP